MSEYSKYLYWQYRRNLLITRNPDENHGIIHKLERKIRKYEEAHPQ